MLLLHRRNRSFLLLPMLAVWLAAHAPAAAQETPGKRAPGAARFVPGEAIVKMKEATVAAEADARIGQLGFERTAAETSGGEIVVRLGAAALAARASGAEIEAQTLEMIETLEASPNVEYAQPNYILDIAAVPDDPRFPEQWHYQVNGSGAGESPGGINLPIAWDVTTGDPGIVVAVIDTGILPDHPDIAGSPNLVAGFDMIRKASNARDGDGRDADPTDEGDAVLAGQCGSGPPRDQRSSWHGTHVAGTIGVGLTDNAAGVAGVNWRTRVQAVRVLGRCGGDTIDINDAIRWAAGLPVPGVPANATPAKVLNLSLGAPISCKSSPSTQRAIDDAVAAGATVVVAAGNAAANAGGYFPASCDNVITVAASNPDGELVTRYSNYGAVVEILAPGGDLGRREHDAILSMVEGGYAFYNGTSMAAPHVAGVAALLLAVQPGLSPAQVRSRLEANSQPRSDRQCPQLCGAGLLDADLFSDKLRLGPSELTLGKQMSRQVTARVVTAGVPAAGVTVSFSSQDAAVATVSPPSAVTDAQGRAMTTVTRQGRGDTAIVARVAGRPDAQARVRKAPVGSILGFLLVILLMTLRLRREAGPEGHRG